MEDNRKNLQKLEELQSDKNNKLTITQKDQLEDFKVLIDYEVTEEDLKVIETLPDTHEKYGFYQGYIYHFIHEKNYEAASRIN